MPLVTTTTSEAITTITLNDPDKRNALTIDMMQELNDALETAHDDPTTGILLRGEGPVTCAGADTGIVVDGTTAEKRELLELIESAYHLMLTYPNPTVLACKGAAIGAGFQLTIIVDFTILGTNTVLYKPEIPYGVYSEYSTKMLEHALGTQIAREITLTGDEIDPERALMFGLAKDVVSPEAVDNTAKSLLDDLVSHDSGAFQAAKQAFEFDLTPADCTTYP